MSRWPGRISLAFAGWLLITAAAFLLGNQPRPGLLALMVGAAATVLWVLLDVPGELVTGRWRAAAQQDDRPVGEDPRLALLHRAVAQHLDSREVNVALHRRLTELADSQLEARHGVSRRSDPNRAAQLLGPDLSALVTEASGRPPYPRLSLDRIHRVITEIEDL